MGSAIWSKQADPFEVQSLVPAAKNYIKNIKTLFKKWALEWCAVYPKLSEATQMDDFTH